MMFGFSNSLPPQEKITLLLSARDTGSVGHIQAVLEEASLHSWCKCIVYADDPAFRHLQADFPAVSRFKLSASPTPTKEYTDRMVAEARRIIIAENPQALLVGVSHCDEAGLDEAFLAAAFDRPKFAIQDFWGDVNSTLGATADVYFALDELAVRLTNTRHGKIALACGSPKHHRYGMLDIRMLRETARNQLGFAADQPIIGYFGQSLAHRSGYADLLRSFARNVADLGSYARLVYRPHPRENDSEIAATLACFSGGGAPAKLLNQGATEQWLAASDVVVSCFSSCAYDAAFLNRYSLVPINAAVYLLHEASVAEYFLAVTGLEVPPPAELGLARAVLHEHSLGDALRQALSFEGKQETWQHARHLPDPKHAARRILEEIRRHVHCKAAMDKQAQRGLM